MNFLAHLYLSGKSAPIIIGNFIGDFIKGVKIEKFDPEILKGISLHRAIDEFTDSHPVVAQSKERMRSKYRHYSGVIVDIFYDHYLAKNWTEYSQQPLNEFVEDFYLLIDEYDSILPDRVKYMMPYMKRHNWLENYAHIEGIQLVLRGMSNRTKFDSKMEESTVELRQYYEEFAEEFAMFFPELKEHSDSILTTLNN